MVGAVTLGAVIGCACRFGFWGADMGGQLTRPAASNTDPETADAVREGAAGVDVTLTGAVAVPAGAGDFDHAAACAAHPPGPLKSVLLAASAAAAWVVGDGFLTQACAALVAASSWGFSLSATFCELWQAHNTELRSGMP